MVKSQKKSNKNARDDNISQAKHGKITGRETFLKKILREDHCKQSISLHSLQKKITLLEGINSR